MQGVLIFKKLFQNLKLKLDVIPEVEEPFSVQEKVERLVCSISFPMFFEDKGLKTHLKEYICTQWKKGLLKDYVLYIKHIVYQDHY